MVFRFYNCVNGVAYELPCATGLVFDEAKGTCVREEQASEFSRKCTKEKKKGNPVFFCMLCCRPRRIRIHCMRVFEPHFEIYRMCTIVWQRMWLVSPVQISLQLDAMVSLWLIPVSRIQ